MLDCFCFCVFFAQVWQLLLLGANPASGVDGGGDVCAAAEVGLRSSMDVVRVVNWYYAYNFADKVGDLPSWSLQDNVPSMLFGGSFLWLP